MLAACQPSKICLVGPSVGFRWTSIYNSTLCWLLSAARRNDTSLPLTPALVVAAAASSCFVAQQHISLSIYLHQPSIFFVAWLTIWTSVETADLQRYEVIITSYSYLSAEHARITRYLRDLQTADELEDPKLAPKRRAQTTFFTDLLLSGFDREDDSVPQFRYLILDEAHTIKNTKSRAYITVQQLRELFSCCIMLTGTPLDNTWADGYALLSMLVGHPVRCLKDMSDMFTEPGPSPKLRPACPAGKYLVRLTRLIDSVSMRRPNPLIDLPPLQYVHTNVEVSRRVSYMSDTKYDEFIKIEYEPDVLLLRQQSQQQQQRPGQVSQPNTYSRCRYRRQHDHARHRATTTAFLPSRKWQTSPRNSAEKLTASSDDRSNT